MRAQRGEYQKAKKCLEQAEASLRTKDAELRALVESEKTSQREHEQAGHDMTDYARRVRSAYDNLPAGLQVLVADVPASEPIGWLESRYPTEADLQVSAGELASRAAHAKSLQQLRLQMEKWQQLDGQLQEARRSLAELRALCPTEEAQLARQENTVLTRRQTDIVSQMGPQEKALAKARAGLTESRGVLEKRRAQLTEVGTRLAVTRAKRDEIEQNIRLASASAPSEWQKEASLVDADRLKALEVEQAGKAQYSSLAAELERATQSIADGEDQIARLGSQIAGIPDPSQRPSGEVEKELATCRSKSAQADTERRQTHAILDRLRAQYEHRKEQEEAHRDVDRQHHLFKVLSTLLGPSGLQLHLLRRAEGVIVALANEALDGLSRGQMRLELRRSQEDGEQSSKALDLMIYNYDTGTRPTAVALASGSQQFRIAVSLALAIGRYAGQEARHVESVIIDEGFGSLDKSARDDMIQELNQLQQQLARVILVSHQEEFAGAFASGYTISLEDNASRVTLLEPA